MQVTIIGAGNVGTVLGRELLRHGHVIKQVWSRRPLHANELAAELHSNAVTALTEILPGADLYLLTVTDDALPAIAAQLSFKDELVVHTAGSVSKEILRTCSSNYGVLWPMKMIRKSMAELGEVTTVADGNSQQTADALQQLARTFSTTVTRAGDEVRLKLHMLASVTSNFTNHLYRLAADYCKQEDIDFSLLYPIIEDTAHRIRSLHPAAMQAGPAFRGDEITMNRHRALLAQHPQLAQLYDEISASIIESSAQTRHPGK